jgi:hypothetical protein
LLTQLAGQCNVGKSRPKLCNDFAQFRIIGMLWVGEPTGREEPLIGIACRMASGIPGLPTMIILGLVMC